MNRTNMAANDAMSLRSLWENADINGGTVDVSGAGPNYRVQMAVYLRELADRIDPTIER